MPTHNGVELSTCGRDWNHDHHRFNQKGVLKHCNGHVPKEAVPWGGRLSAVVLISQNEEEEKRLLEYYPNKFDTIIRNERKFINKIEGLRISKVCLSTEVLLAGIELDLFASIEGTLIVGGVHFDTAFEVVRG